MATFSSEVVRVSQSAGTVFSFLNSPENLYDLMPKDRISDWKSDAETCSFQIKGLAKIGMKLDQATDPTAISFASHGKNPFPFTLNISIKPVDDDSCDAQLVFDGNMNPMLKMMAATPLTNFFNMLAQNLKAKY